MVDILLLLKCFLHVFYCHNCIKNCVLQHLKMGRVSIKLSLAELHYAIGVRIINECHTSDASVFYCKDSAIIIPADALNNEFETLRKTPGFLVNTNNSGQKVHIYGTGDVLSCWAPSVRNVDSTKRKRNTTQQPQNNNSLRHENMTV